MPIDNKYGHVELEDQRSIGDDEPVIVFRAKDVCLPALLDQYLFLCASAGSPKNHLQLIEEAKQQIVWWQEEHGNKIPDSVGGVFE